MNNHQIPQTKFGSSPLFYSFLKPLSLDSSSTSAAFYPTNRHVKITAPSILPKPASPSLIAARTTLPFSRSGETTTTHSTTILIYTES
ncbi:hypothetical protein ACFX13_009453 [Malus domestica]